MTRAECVAKLAHFIGRQLIRIVKPDKRTGVASIGAVGHRAKSEKGHVWTAPGCQGIDHVAALVGAAMCSAYRCGSQGRWP